MQIVFDPAQHAYTNELTGERYLSCTQLLGKYKKKFESDLMASRVAHKRGVSKNEVLAEWAANTKNRCDIGTSIHESIEDWLIDGTINEVHKDIINGLNEILPFKKKKAKPEHLIWNHEFKIAGTSDIIEDASDEYFNVYDFKTNKEFRFANKYKEYLLEPVSHLQNCEYNTYCLQLSLYAWMYSKLTEKKIGKLGILYYSETECKWYLYPVPYMKHEIAAILLHYKKNYM